MHLDPAVRPASAAEVMERLDARSRGYSPTSSCWCRRRIWRRRRWSGATAQLRARRARSRRARCAGAVRALLLEGAPGRRPLAVARRLRARGQARRRDRPASRFERPTRGGYGVVRALAAQLLRALPDLALAAARTRLSVLGHVIPELLSKTPGVMLEKLEDPEQLSRSVQPALRRWLIDVSRRKPLLIAVDDVHDVDEPSAAFLALLSQEISEHAIVVATTATSDARAPASVLAALKLLSASSTLLPVDALGVAYTEQLLRSVFGDVPNLQLLAHRLHGISGGLPRDILRLAQHLVDEGVVRYQAGAWSVPDQRRRRRAAVEHGAGAQGQRRCAVGGWARARSNTGPRAAPALHASRNVCCSSSTRKPARLMRRLDALVAAGIVRPTAALLQPRSGGAALRARRRRPKRRPALTPAARRGVSPPKGRIPAAQHLVYAGRLERGLDALIEHAERSRAANRRESRGVFRAPPVAARRLDRFLRARARALPEARTAAEAIVPTPSSPVRAVVDFARQSCRSPPLRRFDRATVSSSRARHPRRARSRSRSPGEAETEPRAGASGATTQTPMPTS